MLLLSVTYPAGKQLLSVSMDKIPPFAALANQASVVFVDDGPTINSYTYNEDNLDVPDETRYTIYLPTAVTTTNYTVTSATTWQALFTALAPRIIYGVDQTNFPSPYPEPRFVLSSNGKCYESKGIRNHRRCYVHGCDDNPGFTVEVDQTHTSHLNVLPTHTRYRYFGLRNIVPVVGGLTLFPIQRTFSPSEPYLQIPNGAQYLHGTLGQNTEIQFIDFGSLVGDPFNGVYVNNYPINMGGIEVSGSAIRITLPVVMSGNQNIMSLNTKSVIFSIFGRLFMIDGVSVKRVNNTTIDIFPQLLNFADTRLIGTLAKWTTANKTIALSEVAASLSTLRQQMIDDLTSTFMIVVNTPNVYMTTVAESYNLRDGVRRFPAGANAILRNRRTGQIHDYATEHYPNITTVAIQNKPFNTITGKSSDNKRWGFLRLPRWYTDKRTLAEDKYEMIDFISI